ncbi:hypothetical protein BD626DRAFT_494615 [Schizophyllum amplum]|uniref:F-box domain-containing protein n=1 Tax=Schizophyllum amplum TaxID=97359 RepID=A0A550CFF8_9AGAR|nr:hypothetical protein BD626DRAFT_494615 [Auriculariopsis ampla]
MLVGDLPGISTAMLEHIATSPARLRSLISRQTQPVLLDAEKFLRPNFLQVKSTLCLPVPAQEMQMRDVLLVRGGRYLLAAYDGQIQLWDLWRRSNETSIPLASRDIQPPSLGFLVFEDYWFGDNGRLFVALASHGVPQHKETTLSVYAIDVLANSPSFEKVNELHGEGGRVQYCNRHRSLIAFIQRHTPQRAGIWDYRTSEGALWPMEEPACDMLLDSNLNIRKVTCVQSERLKTHNIPELTGSMQEKYHEWSVTITDNYSRRTGGPCQFASYHTPLYNSDPHGHVSTVWSLLRYTRDMPTLWTEGHRRCSAALLPLTDAWRLLPRGHQLRSDELVALFHTVDPVNWNNGARSVIAAVVPRPESELPVAGVEPVGLLSDTVMDPSQIRFDPTSGTFAYWNPVDPDFIHLVCYLNEPADLDRMAEPAEETVEVRHAQSAP